MYSSCFAEAVLTSRVLGVVVGGVQLVSCCVVCSSQDSAANVMEAKPRSHSSSDGESRVRRAAPASAAIKKGHKSDATEKQRALSSSSVAETKRSRSKGQGNA